MTKVDAFSVTQYVREHTLNEKFKGTWVLKGLNDEVAKKIFNGSSRRPSGLVEEVLSAD